jgi:hypothetical protein
MGLDRQNGAAAGKSPPIWIYGLLEDGKTFFSGSRFRRGTRMVYYRGVEEKWSVSDSVGGCYRSSV